MTAETQIEEAASTHETGQVRHPSPGQYWLIGIVLAVVTGLEVSVTYIDALDGPPVVLMLFAFGAIKFGMVVALFMHLKFDKPLYRNFFLVGLAGAITMYVVVLLTFRAL